MDMHATIPTIRSRYDFDGLGQLLPYLAASYRERVALITSSRSLTFEELDVESSNFAAALQAEDVRPGDRVSLFASNRWEWVVAYHAVLKLGAVVNPLNVMLTPDEVQYVMADAGSSVLIGSESRLGIVTDVAENIPTLRLLVSFDEIGSTSSGIRTIKFRDLISVDAPDFSPADVDPNTLACIAYTSGTTGRPKGAMQSHRSLVLNCAYTATMHGRNHDDTVVTSLPCTHVYGNVAINGSFMAGAKVVLMERFDPQDTLDLIGKHGATLLEGVPAMYAMLLDSPGLRHADLSTLTRSTVGGQTIATSVVDAWESVSGASLIELWGMTELSGLGTTHALYAPNVHGSIGVALPGTEVAVLDLDGSGRTVPAGQAGELVVRGPLVTMGYFNDEQSTSDAIDSEGWLHTGDVATRDDEGHFFVVDRLKDMILTGGYNVYPSEIERVLIGHSAVALTAVGREPDPVKGEVAHAYVVLSSDQTATEAELIEYTRKHLAAYKIPRAIHFVTSLPTTSSGKLMRRKLREHRSSEQNPVG